MAIRYIDSDKTEKTYTTLGSYSKIICYDNIQIAYSFSHHQPYAIFIINISKYTHPRFVLLLAPVQVVFKLFSCGIRRTAESSVFDELVYYWIFVVLGSL